MSTVTLPLYNPSAADPEQALSEMDRTPRTPSCSRCEASSGSTFVCARPDGMPGGVLVLGEWPTEDDARNSGRPFSGKVGRYVRGSIAQHYKGPVAYDNALRCRPRGKLPTDAKTRHAVESCQTYTAELLASCRPERILIMGQWALMSLFGRDKYPRISRGYQWLRFDGMEIPVFFLPRLAPTFGNRLLKRKWADDLEWALTSVPEKPPWMGETTMVTTHAQAKTAVDDIRASQCGIIDVETYGDRYEPQFRVLCVSVGRLDSDVTYTWDTRNPDPEVVGPLIDLITDPTVGKGGHNFKYDIVALERYFKVRMQGKTVDTRLVHKLLECTEQADLDACADQVGCGGHKAEAKYHVDTAVKLIRKYRTKIKADLAAAGTHESYATSLQYATDKLQLPAMMAHAVASMHEKPQKYAYAFMDRDVLHRYCARDVVSTGRIWRLLWRRLCHRSNADIKQVWDKLVQPATGTIARIEQNGMPVDLQALDDFRSFLQARETEILMQMHQHTARYFPDGFNVNSTPQIQSLLFEHMKLPVLKKTPQGKPSADKEVLEELRGHHDIVPLLLEYRVITKLQGTYGDGLAAHVKADSRIHCSFNIVGAETGRMSCTEPNMQTIPSRGEYAKMAKNVFAAPPGYKLVQFDFSQLELRVAAMVSGDPVMKAIYAEGRDYHSETATLIAPSAYGVVFEKATEAMREADPQRYHLMDDIRRAAKVVNFGLIYGMGDGALAKGTRTSPPVAAKMREAVMGKLRVLDAWTRACVRTANATGYVSTIWDGAPARRRYLWNIAIEGDSDYAGKQRSNAENGAYNSPIQGTASDYCLASLVAIDRWLDDEGIDAQVVMTVHDSIVLVVADALVPIVVPTVRGIMTGWPSYGVPLEVDCEVGQSWGALTGWKKWCEKHGLVAS